MNYCNHNKEADNRSLTTGTPADRPDNLQKPLYDTASQMPKKHKPMNHMLHMGLCCGLPLLLLMVLPLIGYNGALLKLAPLICPIMMLVMIPMMLKGRGSSCHNNSNPNDAKPLEEKPN